MSSTWSTCACTGFARTTERHVRCQPAYPSLGTPANSQMKLPTTDYLGVDYLVRLRVQRR